MTRRVFDRKDRPLSRWSAKLGLGAQSHAGEAHSFQIDAVLVNPHYNRLTKQADVAMMRLSAPANFTGMTAHTYTYPLPVPVIVARK